MGGARRPAQLDGGQRRLPLYHAATGAAAPAQPEPRGAPAWAGWRPDPGGGGRRGRSWSRGLRPRPGAGHDSCSSSSRRRQPRASSRPGSYGRPAASAQPERQTRRPVIVPTGSRTQVRHGRRRSASCSSTPRPQADARPTSPTDVATPPTTPTAVADRPPPAPDTPTQPIADRDTAVVDHARCHRRSPGIQQPPAIVATRQLPVGSARPRCSHAACATGTAAPTASAYAAAPG